MGTLCVGCPKECVDTTDAREVWDVYVAALPTEETLFRRAGIDRTIFACDEAVNVVAEEEEAEDGVGDTGTAIRLSVLDRALWASSPVKWDGGTPVTESLAESIIDREAWAERERRVMTIGSFDMGRVIGNASNALIFESRLCERRLSIRERDSEEVPGVDAATLGDAGTDLEGVRTAATVPPVVDVDADVDGVETGMESPNNDLESFATADTCDCKLAYKSLFERSAIDLGVVGIWGVFAPSAMSEVSCLGVEGVLRSSLKSLEGDGLLAPPPRIAIIFPSNRIGLGGM